jgi:chemotaxis protein methyltransferase CheR
MPAPGYLCVGASESLLSVTSAFSLEEIDGAFVYVKRAGDE